MLSLAPVWDGEASRRSEHLPEVQVGQTGACGGWFDRAVTEDVQEGRTSFFRTRLTAEKDDDPERLHVSSTALFEQN